MLVTHQGTRVLFRTQFCETQVLKMWDIAVYFQNSASLSQILSKRGIWLFLPPSPPPPPLFFFFFFFFFFWQNNCAILLGALSEEFLHRMLLSLHGEIVLNINFYKTIHFLSCFVFFLYVCVCVVFFFFFSFFEKKKK